MNVKKSLKLNMQVVDRSEHEGIGYLGILRSKFSRLGLQGFKMSTSSNVL